MFPKPGKQSYLGTFAPALPSLPYFLQVSPFLSSYQEGRLCNRTLTLPLGIPIAFLHFICLHSTSPLRLVSDLVLCDRCGLTAVQPP